MELLSCFETNRNNVITETITWNQIKKGKKNVYTEEMCRKDTEGSTEMNAQPTQDIFVWLGRVRIVNILNLVVLLCRLHCLYVCPALFFI